MRTLVASAALLGLTGFVFCNDTQSAHHSENRAENDFVISAPAGDDKNQSTVQILDRYELPDELREVSGIVFLDKDLFACIQDEKGVVYFYDAAEKKIRKEISFAGNGDYEGITMANRRLFVLRSDGKLFELEDFQQAGAPVKEFDTGLEAREDFESVCFDAQGNRLLIVGKAENKSDRDQRKVYAFDLETGKTSVAMTIDLTLDIPGLETRKGKVKFSPSDMDIHPVTGDIYMTDGPAACIYRLDASAKIRQVYRLDSKEVPQVEGISFSESGEIFISSEGNKKPGAIYSVKLP
jgi:hypothetical protein